jgi:hypothetical protein
MSVYVERCGARGDRLAIGRLTADCRGELLAFADRLGLGVPRLHRRGTPDEYVDLTPLGWRAAIALGALEIVWVDGVEHLRAPAGVVPTGSSYSRDLAS